MNTVRVATEADIRAAKNRDKRELAVLKKAAVAFRRADRLAREARVNSARLDGLCRSFDAVSGTRGFTHAHLRRACEARGLFDETTS